MDNVSNYDATAKSRLIDSKHRELETDGDFVVTEAFGIKIPASSESRGGTKERARNVQK